MTDSSGDGAQAAGAQPATPQIALNAQYVKDLSFENPNAPQSLVAGAPAPKIEVSVDVQARALGENRYEVELRITATATREEARAFVAEVQYAGLFTIANFDDQTLRAVCLIECPRLLFPFARRVVADITRDGGFPPLLLEPIDFAALFRAQANAQANNQTQAQPAAEPG